MGCTSTKYTEDCKLGDIKDKMAVEFKNRQKIRHAEEKKYAEMLEQMISEDMKKFDVAKLCKKIKKFIIKNPKLHQYVPEDSEKFEAIYNFYFVVEQCVYSPTITICHKKTHQHGSVIFVYYDLLYLIERQDILDRIINEMAKIGVEINFSYKIRMDPTVYCDERPVHTVFVQCKIV